MRMFELGTLWRITPRFNVQEMRDVLAAHLDDRVCVQALEGDRKFALFEGDVHEVTSVFEGRGKLSSQHAVLFWLYDSHGNLNGQQRTFGFSNQQCDLARVTAQNGVLYQESTLLKEWNKLYVKHRKKMNGSGDIHTYKTLLANYRIKV